MKMMRVSLTSNPNSIAQALSSQLKKNGGVEMEIIGAGAISQAVKAMTISRGLLKPCGLDLFFRPEFIELEKEGLARTGIRFLISKSN